MTFENPHSKSRYKGLPGFFKALADLARWKAGTLRDPEFSSPPPAHFSLPERPTCDLEKPWVMWVNHSSFLISAHGVNFLTDPVFAERCSPVSFVGPKRHHPPGIEFKDLPKIDYVLISHDHYDHLDKAAVRALHARFPEIVWLVPTGVGRHLKRWGISNIRELGWWDETLVLPEQIRFTAVPAQHFSGRSPFSFNATLWCGFVVEFQRERRLRFYFVGDTGYNPHDFRAIGEKFAPLDLALIPIGCYNPRRFLAPMHVEPRDAVHIHREVGSRLSIGMHWKTFRLSDEPMERPPYDLAQALAGEELPPFVALQPGYRHNF